MEGQTRGEGGMDWRGTADKKEAGERGDAIVEIDVNLTLETQSPSTNYWVRTQSPDFKGATTFEVPPSINQVLDFSFIFFFLSPPVSLSPTP